MATFMVRQAVFSFKKCRGSLRRKKAKLFRRSSRANKKTPRSQKSEESSEKTPPNQRSEKGLEGTHRSQHSEESSEPSKEFQPTQVTVPRRNKRLFRKSIDYEAFQRTGMLLEEESKEDE